LLQGATELSLDAKGRLAVPTRYRDALLSGGRAVVLTAHPDSCLLLYPRVAWEPIGAKVQALSSFNEQARWWQRLLSALPKNWSSTLKGASSCRPRYANSLD